MSEYKMPPLPEPDLDEDTYSVVKEGWVNTKLWREEKMRDYARQAVLAERERCAKVCEELWEIDGSHTAKQFAAAIRARPVG